MARLAVRVARHLIVHGPGVHYRAGAAGIRGRGMPSLRFTPVKLRGAALAGSNPASFNFMGVYGSKNWKSSVY